MAIPGKPTLSAGGESVTITWEPVATAVCYTLYFTDNGINPASIMQYLASDITNTSYKHEQLDPEKNYKYAVQAVNAEGQSSALSQISDAILPNPRLTMNYTFPGYFNSKIGVITLDMPYNGMLPYYTGEPTEVQTYSFTTDADGFVAPMLDLDHTRFWGFTVFKDLDANEVLSTNDIVWGIGGSGTYAVLWYSVRLTYSITWPLTNWDAAASGNHVY